eukprot:10124807-Alexandrium_andersonii.AAC.1
MTLPSGSFRHRTRAEGLPSKGFAWLAFAWVRAAPERQKPTTKPPLVSHGAAPGNLRHATS